MTTARYLTGCASGSEVPGLAYPSDYAWIVNLHNGNVNRNNQSNHNNVRAVRAGECHDAVSLRSLHSAWARARRGKKPSPDQLSFDAYWIDQLLDLQRRLTASTWSPGKPTCFVATAPKAREIHAPPFADRVVHHWLVPQLEAIFEPKFIFDSYSNRVGKGTHAAVERLQGFMRQVYSGQTQRESDVHRTSHFSSAETEARLRDSGRSAGLASAGTARALCGNNIHPGRARQDGSRDGRPRNALLPLSDHLECRPAGDRECSGELQRWHRGQDQRSEFPNTRPYVDRPSEGIAGIALGSPARTDEIKGHAYKAVNGGWYLQLDIRNFFNSIHRPTLYAMLKARIGSLPAAARHAVHALLRRSPVENGAHFFGSAAERAKVPAHKRLENALPGCGLAIGNLSSQFFANVYLDALDQFVKHELKAQRYLRYVDDFVLVHREREQLQAWAMAIAAFLRDRLRLELKADIKLKPLSAGCDFLGYVIYPSHRTVRRRVVGHLREKLRTWPMRSASQPAAPAKLRSVIASYTGHFKHASSFKARRRIGLDFPWLKPFLSKGQQ